MALDGILAQFSQNRLDSEPVPDDVQLLLANRKKFSERTGVELNWKKKWAPWLDTSYLRPDELANPDIAANLRAIEEVCGLIAFIAANEDDSIYFGYWRGPRKRSIAKSPVVCLDSEGQFRLLAGSRFAEAILVATTFDPEQFAEMRDWLRSLGIKIRWETLEKAKWPKDKDKPDELHRKLYYRYLGKKPPH
jgi:hypothetical protein